MPPLAQVRPTCHSLSLPFTRLPSRHHSPPASLLHRFITRAQFVSTTGPNPDPANTSHAFPLFNLFYSFTHLTLKSFCSHT